MVRQIGVQRTDSSSKGPYPKQGLSFFSFELQNTKKNKEMLFNAYLVLAAFENLLNGK